MKKLIIILCLLPLFSLAQKKEITVRITQDNESYLLDKYETTVLLKRKGFKIQVLLSNVDGVYTFASFTDSLCCRIAEKDTFPRFSLLPDISMDEPDFNKDKELLVGDGDCSYWYYDKIKNTTRFNKKIVLLDSNRYVGIKSVKQIYIVPQQRTMKLKDLRVPLYLFFVAVDELDDRGKPKKELYRRRVKIEWTDDN